MEERTVILDPAKEEKCPFTFFGNPGYITISHDMPDDMSFILTGANSVGMTAEGEVVRVNLARIRTELKRERRLGRG